MEVGVTILGAVSDSIPLVGGAIKGCTEGILGVLHLIDEKKKNNTDIVVLENKLQCLNVIVEVVCKRTQTEDSLKLLKYVADELNYIVHEFESIKNKSRKKLSSYVNSKHMGNDLRRYARSVSDLVVICNNIVSLLLFAKRLAQPQIT
ncbi:hypothetical protein SCHPADRAFT_132931 [Schizopora paradoxa]|uniref:Fungal N-terminal domain-containing protein n=1 Tax=Schizopora paradoxa TaxID=27342 RepID=A0A0H2SM91_9AGAM|nr:hypothetical protein SCHPADRAFT_132931 [Schizopora paradoxa]